jgi:hypothetical protein
MLQLADREVFDELSFYTLARPDPAFIHQNAVDAYFAQTATQESKPITVVFALVGLYLHVERGFTGKQVQNAHVQLAKRRKQWPELEPPTSRGTITVNHVIRAAEGRPRDAMIRRWCECVWKAWESARPEITALLKRELDFDWPAEVMSR